jgi:hypothetical protein
MNARPKHTAHTCVKVIIWSQIYDIVTTARQRLSKHVQTNTTIGAVFPMLSVLQPLLGSSQRANGLAG